MYKLFRFCTFLMTLSLGSLFANSHPAPGEWELSADYLFLKPTFDDTYFVIKSPQTTTFPNGRRENNDFDFESGFRVGAKYALCDCASEAEISYTWLGASEKKVVSGDFLWGTIGRADFASAFENYTGSAGSKLHLLYQRLDALYSQEIYNCCGLDFYLQFGLETAYLRLNEQYEYLNVTTLGEIDQRSKTWGVGPQLGIALDYELCECTCFLPGTLSLNVVSSGSILASETSTNERNILAGTSLLNVSDRNTWRTIPAFHSRVGLNYDVPYSCFDINFEIGYEFSSYLRALSRVSFPDDVADGLASTNYYNFDVQGLYVSASVRF